MDSKHYNIYIFAMARHDDGRWSQSVTPWRPHRSRSSRGRPLMRWADDYIRRYRVGTGKDLDEAGIGLLWRSSTEGLPPPVSQHWDQYTGYNDKNGVLSLFNTLGRQPGFCVYLVAYPTPAGCSLPASYRHAPAASADNLVKFIYWSRGVRPHASRSRRPRSPRGVASQWP